MLRHFDSTASASLRAFSHSLDHHEQRVQEVEEQLARAQQTLEQIQRHNAALRARVSHVAFSQRLEALEKERGKLTALIAHAEESLTKQRQALERVRAPRKEKLMRSAAGEVTLAQRLRQYITRASRVSTITAHRLKPDESVEAYRAQLVEAEQAEKGLVKAVEALESNVEALRRESAGVRSAAAPAAALPVPSPPPLNEESRRSPEAVEKAYQQQASAQAESLRVLTELRQEVKGRVKVLCSAVETEGAAFRAAKKKLELRLQQASESGALCGEASRGGGAAAVHCIICSRDVIEPFSALVGSGSEPLPTVK